ATPISDLTDLCPGDYTLVAIDDAECTFTDTLSLSEPPALIVTDSVNQSLCAGDDMGAIFLTVSGGSPDYSFDWDDPDLEDIEDQSDLDPGDYSVTVSDFNGCEVELELTVDEPDSLSTILISPVLLGPDFNISIYLGSDGIIDATVEGGTEPYTFNWTGDDGFSADTEDISELIAQNYCLEVTDANGCIDGECILLTEPDDLELPNGMSPNGDGRNDGLIIQGIEAFPDNTVKVFNRWGDEVFMANGYSNSNLWRGESDSGGIVPDGTYFVILVVKDGEGERELNAYLEVRR
ncbi:MAG: T9SS type B sorting domain-containing protein, partial [Flavobacteriales bacterium]|nr:T9SS type B sorting domain-containing protein [Flavobacteriales bacterium]